MFYKKNSYIELFNAETEQASNKKVKELNNAIAYKSELYCTPLLSEAISNFLYAAINLTTQQPNAASIMTYETMSLVAKSLFKHFTASDDAIDDVLTKYNDYSNNNPNGTFKDYLEEKYGLEIEVDAHFKVTMKQIGDVYGRLCIVPLKISASDHRDQLILAVSVHGRKKEVGDIKSHVEKIFMVLDAIGISTRCTAIVIGGDFNVDVEKELKDFLNEKSFLVPSYYPTLHRLMHGRSCIDYIAYKNYRDDYMIQIEEVVQMMLIPMEDRISSDIVIVEGGQCNIKQDKASNHFKNLDAISDHDPLLAKLILYHSPVNPSEVTPSSQDDSSQHTPSSQDDSSQDTPPLQDDSSQDASSSESTDSPQGTQNVNTLQDTHLSQDTNLPPVLDTNSLKNTDVPQHTQSPEDVDSSCDYLTNAFSGMSINVKNDCSKQQGIDKLKMRLNFDD